LEKEKNIQLSKKNLLKVFTQKTFNITDFKQYLDFISKNNTKD